MGLLGGYSPSKVHDCLKDKLGISFRSNGELNGWYCLGGKKVLRVTIPKGHSKELGSGTVRRIIGNLRLNSTEFKNLYNCPMSGKDYEAKVRSLKII